MNGKRNRLSNCERIAALDVRIAVVARDNSGATSQWNVRASS
jgi:hypothetical protein